MGMNLIERIKDWYLTKKTGKTKSEREYDEWYFANVCLRSTRVKDIFHGFEHIIAVDPNKFFDLERHPFMWYMSPDVDQYFWPQKPIGECSVYQFLRVMKAPSTTWQWEVNELGGEDKVFVATNNEADAVMIALKYS